MYLFKRKKNIYIYHVDLHEANFAKQHSICYEKSLDLFRFSLVF